MWGGKHSDLYMRSDVFVQNITMHLFDEHDNEM